MKNIKEISLILSKIHSAKTIEEFLFSILTPNEVKNVSSRWEIVKRIEKGTSQRKIAKDLRLSLCKITRGSRELKKANSVLKMILKKYRSVIKS
ncbi:MAG: transcriptional regulator [Calditrichia bacterium]|jgi:TrpR family trp operon transcriptional repressor|nr:transcriptional regulator [Calditrichia bacterium]